MLCKFSSLRLIENLIKKMLSDLRFIVLLMFLTLETRVTGEASLGEKRDFITIMKYYVKVEILSELVQHYIYHE